MGNKPAPRDQSSIILGLLGLGVAFVFAFGSLIALVSLRGGTDNLTIAWGFLLVGIVMCILGGVGKLCQR